ncbi:hypothetical protein B296_00030774 [Ensete ventricosum]|uniref:Transposase (putative) gypsy type domain-containing protein n=1 Tax=Ensete ventricosum TaxID=4639 RepID=A0A426ZT75_ENSVE|nr:hypothetical protein B296_00030774 [Ensete ventricosum]
MLAERHISSTTGLMLAERHISSTTGLMLVEMHVSGTIDMKLAKNHVSGAIGLMMAERHVSGTTGLMMAERHVLGTIGLMMAERHVSGTTRLMLAERHVSSMTRPILLKSVHREHPSVCHMASTHTFRPRLASEGIRSKGRATSISGSSHSRIPSSEDAWLRKDLEVMKSCHDIASVISEEALESIQECYRIPEGSVLRAPSPEQWPYQPQPSEISISVDALEAGLRFPLHPTIVECLRRWRISPNQMAPNSWRYLIAFLGECRGAGIVPSRTLFFAYFCLCKSQGGYYLTARAGFKVSGALTNNKGAMDLNVLQKKPWMLGGNGAPAADPKSVQPEVEVTHTKASGKRPAGSPAPDPTATGRPRKWVKIAVRKYKAHHREGSLRRATQEREPEVSAKDTSLTYCQPKSMRDLCGMRVLEDDEGYYVLQMADWAPRDSSAVMQARWPNLSYQSRVWDDPKAASEFDQGVLHPMLAKDLYTLPSEVLIARAAKHIMLGHHYHMALLDRVHDSGRLVTHMGNQASLHEAELEKLRSQRDPKQLAQAKQQVGELEANNAKLKSGGWTRPTRS